MGVKNEFFLLKARSGCKGSSEQASKKSFFLLLIRLDLCHYFFNEHRMGMCGVRVPRSLSHFEDRQHLQHHKPWYLGKYCYHPLIIGIRKNNEDERHKECKHARNQKPGKRRIEEIIQHKEKCNCRKLDHQW